MSLFPITELDANTAAQGNNLLPAGTLIVIPIDMTSVRMTQITVAQVSATQDYSMRTWLSEFPDGVAIAPGPFPVLRTSGLPFVVYITGQTPPDGCYAMLVTPGTYILNIVNLTNEANLFSFSKTDLA